MGQDIFDLIVILVLVFFTGRGMYNGFIGEAAGIVALVGGFWAANTFHTTVVPRITFVADPTWRPLVAYALIFIGVMVLVGVIAQILRKILQLSFAVWIDRLAGLALGLCKGLLVCSLLLIIVQKFFYDADFVRHSRTLPYLQSIMQQIRDWLPDDLTSRLGFNLK